MVSFYLQNLSHIKYVKVSCQEAHVFHFSDRLPANFTFLSHLKSEVRVSECLLGGYREIIVCAALILPVSVP